MQKRIGFINSCLSAHRSIQQSAEEGQHPESAESTRSSKHNPTTLKERQIASDLSSYVQSSMNFIDQELEDTNWLSFGKVQRLEWNVKVMNVEIYFEGNMSCQLPGRNGLVRVVAEVPYEISGCREGLNEPMNW